MHAAPIKSNSRVSKTGENKIFNTGAKRLTKKRISKPQYLLNKATTAQIAIKAER
ncbi:hypothetical protein D3C80_2037510 [compost metagenome]